MFYQYKKPRPNKIEKAIDIANIDALANFLDKSFFAEKEKVRAALLQFVDKKGDELDLIKLELTDENLEKSILPLLKECGTIKTLDLSLNELTNESVKLLEWLELNYLGLAGNNINELCSKDLPNLKAKEIDLSYNPLGSLAFEFFKENNVCTSLTATACEIGGLGVKYILQCTSLQKVELDDNLFSKKKRKIVKDFNKGTSNKPRLL